ncbi:MAG: peptidylprolyl isomerase [Chloroflexota bacterium]|nr:peptidylprolyl isomerase [Chloroflexota bacterium]
MTEAVLAHETRAAGLEDVADLVDDVTAEVRVSDDDLRAYYDRNGDLFARAEVRRIGHSMVHDEDAAVRAVAALAEGDSAVNLDVLDVRRGELAGPLEEAIFTAREGDVLGPIQSELGWHVARLERVTPAGVVPYADARPAIEAELLAAARLTAFGQWLDRRRDDLAVIEPAFAHPADPVNGFPSHRH